MRGSGGEGTHTGKPKTGRGVVFCGDDALKKRERRGEIKKER